MKIRIIIESYAELVSQKNRFPFRPGMTASVDIITQKKDNVLSVPLAAVTTREDQTNQNPDGTTKLKELIYIVENGKSVQKEIKTGISDFDNIEIIEGVNEGDEIVGDTIVLLVKVSVPAKVAIVPVVGKVIFVAPVLVKVVL